MALRVHAALIQDEVEELVIEAPERTIYASNTVEGPVAKTIYSPPRNIDVLYSGSSVCYLTVNGTTPTPQGDDTYAVLKGITQRIPVTMDQNRQCTVKVVTGDHDGKVSIEGV